MATKRAVLLIADIGGYTRFMNLHRLALSHAQDIVARLLEAVIDGAGDAFTVAKLEGDAVFLYADAPSRATFPVSTSVQAIRQAFTERLQSLSEQRLCSCDPCVGAGKLKIKFVVHVGEIAFQRVKSFNEVAGLDVIVVHRLLKNSVPISEYALMTEAVLPHLEESVKPLAKQVQEDLEGVGPTVAHYLDLDELGLKQPLPERRPPLLEKLRALIAMNARSLPYVLGLRKPCAGFRQFDEACAVSANEGALHTSRSPGEQPAV